MKKYPRIIIHFNGAYYYYTTKSGLQVSKAYTSVNRLRKYGITDLSQYTFKTQ